MKKQIKKRWYKDWKSWAIILLALGVIEMAMEEDCEAQTQNEEEAIEAKADVKEEMEEEVVPEIVGDEEKAETVEEVIAELTTEDLTYSVLGRDFDLLTGDSNIVYEKGLFMIKTSSRTGILRSIFNHDGTVIEEGAVDSTINDFKAVAKALIENDIDFDHLSMGFSRKFERGNLISDVANLTMTREELENSINHESWEILGKLWLRQRGKLFIHPDFH